MAVATSGQAPADAGRSTVIVSDLHMGAGRDSAGVWDARERFRWSADFAAFLDAIDRAGAGAVDLVLNGDTFELLGGGQARCSGAVSGLGCSESEALGHLERVLEAHEPEVRALARFARNGTNRVVLVPGDRDAALLFPRVSRRAIAALGVPAERTEVAATGAWTSLDGQLRAEHGHQMRPSAHQFETWPSPFVTTGGSRSLARPWGESLDAALSDRFESRYPIVWHVAALGAGWKYAVAADEDRTPAAVDLGVHAAPLARYLLFTMMWQQFRIELDDGEVEPPVWNLAEVRAQGAGLLAAAVPDDDPFKAQMTRALGDGRLRELAASLSDEEVVALCDHRAAVRRARRRFEPTPTQFDPRGPAVTECPRTPETRGAVYEYFWGSRDRAALAHLNEVNRAVPTRPVRVLVHGHTHLPSRSQASANMISGGLLKVPMEGFSPVRGQLMPIIIDGGAWQRTTTPVQLERLKRQRSMSSRQLLETLRPEHLPPCYSFIEIPPYASTPEPRVRYWRQAERGTWDLASGCGRDLAP
jgi:UDP-2,3-diacylglucosamine pyrophosphatase LpxH